MPSLKIIRKRIASTKSTQKITRAMKMVAAARLRRAQQRITELRPFAIKTAEVLRKVAERTEEGETLHPLLAVREEREVMLVVIASDRGLAGAFNSNVIRTAERTIREMTADGKHVVLATIGRKAREYFRRRDMEIALELPGVNEKINLGRADDIADQFIDLYSGTTGSPAEGAVTTEGEASGHEVVRDTPDEEHRLDSVYLIYNEFKSAMTQRVTVERLLPVVQPTPDADADARPSLDYLYEPDRKALLDRLLPIYVQVSVYRALLESVASNLGAQMTAMDSATNNAKAMIAKLTLQYNRARQAAITKELMEIIGGAEALK